MSGTPVPLKQLLHENTRTGTLCRPLDGDAVECTACGHRCIVREGRDGICKVRHNRGGTLYVPWGYTGGLAVDPIEKKPFFHAMPGSRAMSFGMLGCDMHCAYCQNWITSQVLRDPAAIAYPEITTPEDIVTLAVRNGAQIVTSTYNEPLITSEWAVEIFKLARRYGLGTSYVSNGNATTEVIAYLKPWVDLFKVDLKGFNDRNYRQLGALLSTVCDTIRILVKEHFWVEVVTLIVPGFNDSDDEIRDCARFLASVSKDIPWHVTAFHTDYRMQETGRTPARALVRASEIARGEGLRYVYAGNIPGVAENLENTYCPTCATLLIERIGFRVLGNRLKDGCCPACSTPIPGFWTIKRTRA